MTQAAKLDHLCAQVRGCTICKDLPLGPLPLLQVSPDARILIVGQAPGRKTHEAGIPFDDVSGVRLRDWIGVSKETFYNARKIAILPMGFCYPGTGKSGDLPPRAECAPAWREDLLAEMPNVKLTLVIGRYARDWHIPSDAKASLTKTIQDWKILLPTVLTLPHPSPRNNRWLKQNPWFEQDVLPRLKARAGELLA